MPALLALDTHKPSGRVSSAAFLKRFADMGAWFYARSVFPAGVKLTLSAVIDGKNLHGGGHKAGLGFELEA